MSTLKILGYLGTGIAHEREGIPCQDAIAAKRCANGCTVLALSDGAGSARHAQQAARSCAEAVVSLFGETALADFLQLEPAEQKQRILSACRDKISLLPEFSLEDAPEQYAATLLFLVRDETRLLLGHIGDGAAFAADAQGRCVFVSEPENLEGTNRTFFVSSPGAAEHLRLTVLDRQESGAQAVLLTSDGTRLMLRGRGGGDAKKTAEELLSYIQNGQVSDNAQLADVLRQMAELPCERLDDWSVLILSEAGEGQEELPPPVSMLAEEEEKYAAPQPAAQS